MDIRIVKYFLTIAEEENITKSAELLHITQPTLSRQIMQLEDELGVKLFNRNKYSVTLTEEGMIFKRRALELVMIEKRTKEELTYSQDTLMGEIIIGTNDTYNTKYLSDLISNFRKRYPLVKFTFRSGNNIEVSEWLERGLVDIGLVGEHINTSNFITKKMPYKDKWGILVSSKNELYNQSSITANDLVDVPLITVMDEMIHQELSKWSGPYAKRMIPIAHYNLLSNAIALVKLNEGVAICQEPTCNYDGLRFVPFNPILEFEFNIVWKSNSIFSSLQQTFIDYIEEYNFCISDDLK